MKPKHIGDVVGSIPRLGKVSLALAIALYYSPRVESDFYANDRLEKYFKARKGAFDASGQKLDWRRLHEVHIAVSAAIEESGADISPERFHYIVSQIYNNYSDVGIDKSLILQQIDIPA